MTARLDSEQIETLRAWGAGLAEDLREEVRAAGKAITLLVDEIDRLNIDLWNLRAPGPQQGIFRDDPVFSAPPPAEPSEPTLAATLRDRLLRRRPEDDTGPAPLAGEPGSPGPSGF